MRNERERDQPTSLAASELSTASAFASLSWASVALFLVIKFGGSLKDFALSHTGDLLSLALVFSAAIALLFSIFDLANLAKRPPPRRGEEVLLFCFFSLLVSFPVSFSLSFSLGKATPNCNVLREETLCRLGEGDFCVKLCHSRIQVNNVRKVLLFGGGGRLLPHASHTQYCRIYTHPSNGRPSAFLGSFLFLDFPRHLTWLGVPSLL